MMGFLTGEPTLVASEDEWVYTGDERVVAPPHLAGCGWIPRSEAQAKPGAHVLRVRTLTDTETTTYRDRWARLGEAARNHYAVTVGVIGWGRFTLKDHPAEVRARVAALAQREAMALDLLGRRIIAASRGEDPAAEYAFARQVLGFVPEEGPPDAGDTKSG